MNSPSTRLFCVCVALFAPACTSTSGSSNGGAGAGSGDDGGASSTPAAACAYVETIVTGCSGYDSSTSNVRCDDEPCSEETWDPLPTSVGDCYGYNEYSSQTDLRETCDQWQARGGFGAPATGDGTDAGAAARDSGGASAACTTNPPTGNAACDSCIQSGCGSEWCACAGDPNGGDAGVARCLYYANCLITCFDDAGAADPSGCENQCASGYSASERSNGDALVSCISAQCATSATCG